MAPLEWPLTGTMTREGVRLQHLLRTLRNAARLGIITIDDFLPPSFAAL